MILSLLAEKVAEKLGGQKRSTEKGGKLERQMVQKYILHCFPFNRDERSTMLSLH
jgi:hypothetical protein